MASMLYNDSYSIGSDELNKIYLALLTTTDKIYINANVEINWQDEKYSHVRDSIDKLRKTGYVVFWRFPYERGVNDEIVVNKDKYDMWNSNINNTYFAEDKMISIFHAITTGKTFLNSSEEKTSKILLLRREYWTYGLMDMLRVNTVLNYFSGWMPSPDSVSSITQTPLENSIAKDIFNVESTDVFNIDADDLIYFIKKNKKLKNQLFLLSSQQTNQQTNGEIVNSLLNEAVRANKEIIKNNNASIMDGISTIAGIALNLTPVGPIFELVQNCKSILQSWDSIIGNRDNMFAILIKLHNKFNRKFRNQLK